MNPGPKRKPKEDRDVLKTEDVVIKHDNKASILTQEMRAQGMNLTHNLLKELSNRNLAEVKTVELVKMIIQMFGYFIPKPNDGHNDSIIDITNTDVKSIISQIGVGENKQ